MILIQGGQREKRKHRPYIIRYKRYTTPYIALLLQYTQIISHYSHLSAEEIHPRFGAPLQIVFDNGPENINKIVKKTLEELNVHQRTTFYHLLSYRGVE